MADVSVNIGVDGLSQFKANMQQAQASVKSLDAELKKSEAQYKATGDKEQYLAEKSRILKQQLDQQKKTVAEGEKALKAMREQGVDQASKSYQDLQRKVTEAETAVININTAMGNLEGSEQQAAKGADNLAGSLGGISKKMSLDQVISGVNNITGSLERAARAAISFATDAWGEVMKVAGYADDVGTNAMKYGVTPEEYAKRANLAATWAETSAESYFEAINRIKYNLAEISAEDTGIFEAIGFDPYDTGMFGVRTMKDTEDIFWGIGDALLHMADANQRAALSKKIFGRSWEELNPMFTMGRAEYERLYELTPTNTDEEFAKLATFNDTIGTLKQKFQSLEVTAIAALAPALTEAANAVGLFLDKLMEFLETEDGQKLLDEMGTAISDLFGELANISPDEVVENVVSVFTSITDGLKWLAENKEDVVTALEWIIGGWAGLSVAVKGLEIYKLISGILGLTNTADIAAAGTAAGSSWGGAFATAVLKAAPWLIGVYELLNPASSASNDLDVMFDEKTGRLTTAGWDDFYRNPENWNETLDAVGGLFGDLARITSNPEAMNALGRYNYIGQDEDRLIADLEALGFTRVQPAEPAVTMPEIATVDENGNMYDSSGKKVGFQLPKVEVPAEVEPEIPEDAAKIIAEGIGAVPVPVIPYVPGAYSAPPGDTHGGIGGGGPGSSTYYSMHANGIWAVPFDGYAAILHKNERVVPAREAGSSRNFSSNLYVESMVMNNGTDADGLAAAMAAAQRRTMRGYGS